MSQRLSLCLAGVMVVGGAACSDEMPASSCLLENFRLDGTPLTLLPDARLDRVGNNLALLGSDGDNVRWAGLTSDGVIGAENTLAIPPHVDGKVWFALAGINAPMDHLVVAYVPGPAVAGMVDLMTFSVGFDNTMPTLPAALGQIPAAAQVAMGTGRGGLHAAVAWAVPGSAAVTARILGGDGRAVGSDLVISNAGTYGSCLRFSPGRGDLTLGYVDMLPSPRFKGTEINTSGMAQPPFTLNVGTETPSCIELAPTDTGYGLAWHSDKIGTFLGVYEPAGSQFPSHWIVADNEVRPEDGPLSLAGLGWMGKQYAVVFSRPQGNEVWPFDALGKRQGLLPAFPSAAGHTGVVSTQPVDKVLYATYADYPSAADTSAGVRFLVKVSCP